jgi:hypothetical protein
LVEAEEDAVPDTANKSDVSSNDVFSEHASLVARGVRPLALAGHCFADSDALLRIATQLEAAAEQNVVAFVLDHGDGSASYGYASERWALDLYEWAVRDPAVPQEQRERIIGLLLGYSPPAISRYEDEGSGRRFELVSASVESSAS